MGDRVSDVWGTRTHTGETSWPMRVDGHLEDGIDEGDVDRWVRSACVLCSYGCGVEIAVKGERIVGIRERGDDHVNHGRLGPKGLFGWQAVNAADRLRTPCCDEAATWSRRTGTPRWRGSSIVRGAFSRRVVPRRSGSTPAGSSSSRSTTPWRCSLAPASALPIWMETRACAPPPRMRP